MHLSSLIFTYKPILCHQNTTKVHYLCILKSGRGFQRRTCSKSMYTSCIVHAYLIYTSCTPHVYLMSTSFIPCIPCIRLKISLGDCSSIYHHPAPPPPTLSFSIKKIHPNYFFRCWLSVHDGLIWAFLGPVVFVILVMKVYSFMFRQKQKGNTFCVSGLVNVIFIWLLILEGRCECKHSQSSPLSYRSYFHMIVQICFTLIDFQTPLFLSFSETSWPQRIRQRYCSHFHTDFTLTVLKLVSSLTIKDRSGQTLNVFETIYRWC